MGEIVGSRQRAVGSREAERSRIVSCPLPAARCLLPAFQPSEVHALRIDFALVDPAVLEVFGLVAVPNFYPHTSVLSDS